MEQQWEHKIKNVYHSKDVNASFEKKEQLWSKIAAGRKKSVAPFWRVAAVILALITFGGVFASITVFKDQQDKLVESENRNSILLNRIDSIQNLEPKRIAEIQYVEKEKIVYREVIKPVEKNEKLIKDFEDLNDEFINLSELYKTKSSQLQIARDSLNKFLAELDDFNSSKLKDQEIESQDFKLKPVKSEDIMQPPKPEPSPKIKLQLFKIQNNGIRYNTNSTLLKK